jgi:hypothetical protein
VPKVKPSQFIMKKKDLAIILIISFSLLMTMLSLWIVVTADTQNDQEFGLFNFCGWAINSFAFIFLLDKIEKERK